MERIHCPAPLPKEPTGPLLSKMLVPAPYEAPKKEASKKVKKTRSGLHRRDASHTKSKDSDAHPSFEDEEEEEESNPPLRGRKKKRVTSVDLDAEASKKGRTSLTYDFKTDADSGAPGRSPWPYRKYSKVLMHIYI